MCCVNCGNKLPDGAVFCPKCGTRVEEPKEQEREEETAKESTVPPEDLTGDDQPELVQAGGLESEASPESYPEPVSMPLPAVEQTVYLDNDASVDVNGSSELAVDAPKNASGSRRRAISIVVICALVLAVGVLGFLFWRHGQRARPRPISLTVNVASFGPEDSGIPVHISGTNVLGDQVDQDDFVYANGTGLELPAGSYQITVTASPLTDDGSILAVPDQGIQVDVGEGDPSQTVDSGQTIQMDAVPKREMTREEVQAAYDKAGSDQSFDQSKRDGYRDTANTVVRTYAPSPVKFTVSGDGYDSKDSAIAVHVKGKDVDGSDLPEKDGYVKADGTGLDLNPGTYTITIVAPSIGDEGQVFQPAVSSQNLQVGVPEDFDVTVDTNDTVTVTPVPDDQLTEEMIQQAVNSALGDPNFDQSQLDGFKQAADQRFQSAEEARRKAEEEAKKVQKVKDNALGFAKAYFNNYTLGDLKTEPNGFQYYEMSETPNWKSNCLKYLAKGSSAYSGMSSNSYGSLGEPDSYSIFKSAEVLDASTSSATVSVSFLGGNGELTPGQRPDTLTVHLKFDDDGLITDVSFDR